MKRFAVLFVCLLLLTTPCVLAGTGGLRISPDWPVTVENESTFTVWAQNSVCYDLHLLLVIPQEVYDELVIVGANVQTFNSFGSLQSSDFIYSSEFESATGAGGVFVPSSGTTNGARYTVASLKDHLSAGLEEPLGPSDAIYWVLVPLNDPVPEVGTYNGRFDVLTSEPQELSVTLHSLTGDTLMLIYLLGKSTEDAELFDMYVPPTKPGFMVPEITLGSVMAASTMFTALGIYAYQKKKSKRQEIVT